MAVRPQRRTQQERSAATREALIEATLECLAERGYEGTTTGEISERAGLSRGAHLHHFQTRATLLAAACESLAARGEAELRRGVDGLPDAGDRTGATLDMLWRLFNGPLFQVVLELSVHGRTDPELRSNLDPIEAVLSETTRSHLRRAFTGDPENAGADALITLTVATIRGLAIMPLLEPRRAADGRWPDCRALLLGLFAQHTA